jgi:hypothetical protein
MPGKLGNRNAAKHGVYGYLAIGSLPKGASYIRRQLGRFEGALRDAVTYKHGEVGVYHAALIQTACRHEGRAQLLTRWLREIDGTATITDRVAILREIGSASDARDRCLRLLELDAGGRDVLDALYTTPAQNTHDNPPTPPRNAPDAAGPASNATGADNTLDAKPSNDTGGDDDGICSHL